VLAGVLRSTNHKKEIETRRGWKVYGLDPQDQERFLYDMQLKDLPLGGMVGHVEGLSNRHDQIKRWWLGPFALVLDDVKPLAQPIPIGGRLYFWDVPPDVEGQVKEQLAA
jgi:hypothetical protein